MAGGMAKRHLELVRSFYACGDKNTIRAYVNTPATAKRAIAVRNKYVQVVGFSILPQKTP